MGLEGGKIKRYGYDGGQVLAGAGIDERGAVTVGAVFGSAEELDAGTGSRVFDSLVVLE